MELGYHPSAVARALVRKQTDTLGVIFPRFDSQSPIRGGFFSHVFNEILEAAHLREQDMTILSGRSWKNAQTSLPQYRDGRCDGYIVFFQFDESDLIDAFLDSQVPFVLVNDCRDDARLSCVDVDNHESAFAATRYLLSLGHQRIAHLSGNIPHSPVEGRLQGYKDALKNAGVPFDPRLAPPGDYFFDSVAERVTTLMRLPESERPTGIFCGTDGIAVSALRTLTRLGLRVPEDVFFDRAR
jgi:LacI family transcriptional regulator